MDRNTVYKNGAEINFQIKCWYNSGKSRFKQNLHTQSEKLTALSEYNTSFRKEVHFCWLGVYLNHRERIKFECDELRVMSEF